MHRRFLIPLSCLMFNGVAMAQPEPDEAAAALAAARSALDSGDGEAALEAADKAVALAPQSTAARFIRGEANAALRRHKEAIADYTRAYELDPDLIIAIDRRGGEHFKLGAIEESIRDFEAYLEERPEDFARHWRYGISCYYAGRYDDGAKQFKAGEVHFGDDVENVFWHYLCNVQRSDLKTAREAMLRIEADRPDTRIPMMEVYELIRGESTPEKVMAAAADPALPERGKRERMFYGHLYVGLNHDVLGEREQALEHLKKAVEFKIGHYMWDVGHVHYQRLKAGSEKE